MVAGNHRQVIDELRWMLVEARAMLARAESLQVQTVAALTRSRTFVDQLRKMQKIGLLSSLDMKDSEKEYKPATAPDDTGR